MLMGFVWTFTLEERAPYGQAARWKRRRAIEHGAYHTESLGRLESGVRALTGERADYQ